MERKVMTGSCRVEGRGRVTGARRHLTPFGVDGDTVTQAVVSVGRQRFAVALFPCRALAHVQQARFEESDGANSSVTGGESSGPEYVTFPHCADADLPLTLT